MVALSGLLACTAAPSPSATPAASAPATPSASASPEAVDLTAPGAARAQVERIIEAAGTPRVLAVEVTREEAQVSVLVEGVAQTWAERDGVYRQVESDLEYVSQAAFEVGDFAFDDLGALFRLAAAVSGSDRDQEFQIVDYSAGLVMMTVSTNPESRAVFFHPDGALLPTLDFRSLWGVSAGYADVVGPFVAVHSLSFGASFGVQADAPGPQPGTVVRRQRTARFPVVVATRAEQLTTLAFSPAVVDPAVVWGVVQALHDGGAFTLDQDWSCVAEDRTGSGTPRLHFQVAGRQFQTDLTGQELAG